MQPHRRGYTYVLPRIFDSRVTLLETYCDLLDTVCGQYNTLLRVDDIERVWNNNSTIEKRDSLNGIIQHIVCLHNTHYVIEVLIRGC